MDSLSLAYPDVVHTVLNGLSAVTSKLLKLFTTDNIPSIGDAWPDVRARDGPSHEAADQTISIFKTTSRTARHKDVCAGLPRRPLSVRTVCGTDSGPHIDRGCPRLRVRVGHGAPTETNRDHQSGRLGDLQTTFVKRHDLRDNRQSESMAG